MDSTINNEQNVFRQRLQIYVGWIKRSTIIKMSLDKKKKVVFEAMIV
ncbi:unnamed protein product [Brassica rapa subsp. narinosa]